MDNALRTWLDRNKICSINLKKGGESVYTTDGDNPEDIASQISDIYDGLPSGSYRLLGREKTGTNWANAQTFFFEKKSTNTVQSGTPSGMYPQSGMFTHEQFQTTLELELKKRDFEVLSRAFDKLEAKVDKHEEILRKLVPAVEELLDDDPDNNKSGFDKLTEAAASAKSLFGDFKL